MQQYNLESNLTAALWRQHGQSLRERLIREDEEAGGLTFSIKQNVDIGEYFKLALKILNEFLSRWKTNQSTGEEEWIELLESYKQGNRIVNFLTNVLPMHQDYLSMDPKVRRMREKCNRDLSTVVEMLEEGALTIDQEEFRKQVTRALSRDDGRGPKVPSGFSKKSTKRPQELMHDESHWASQDPPLEILSLDSDASSTQIEGSEPNAVNSFFRPGGSNISLLEQSDATTPMKLKVRTPMKYVYPHETTLNVSSSSELSESNWELSASRDYCVEKKIICPQFGFGDTSSPNDRSWSKHEEATASTVFSADTASSGSFRFQKLDAHSAFISSKRTERHASSSWKESTDDRVTLINGSLNKSSSGQQRRRQDKLGRFKGCIRFVLE